MEHRGCDMEHRGCDMEHLALWYILQMSSIVLFFSFLPFFVLELFPSIVY